MNRFVKIIWQTVMKYNHRKYWKRRLYIQEVKNIGLRFFWYLLYVKHIDSLHNASTGSVLGEGAAFFSAPPILPHGLNGIIIARGSKIGKNVQIFHQVTIGCDHEKLENTPEIGDDVVIFPGAKIFGKVTIGDRVKIGPNAVVHFDVPSDSTVVAGDSYIIDRNK